MSKKRGVRLHYAAYGSNLHPGRLDRRLVSAELIGTARLSGWALRFHKSSLDGSAKCNIVPANAHIHLAIYAMDSAERSVLDRIEGLHTGYGDVLLDVPGFGECFAYRANTTHIDDELAPFSWYKELVLAGCESHSFPTRYVEAIRAIRAVTDPDHDRHALHMQIVAEL